MLIISMLPGASYQATYSKAKAKSGGLFLRTDVFVRLFWNGAVRPMACFKYSVRKKHGNEETLLVRINMPIIGIEGGGNDMK